MPAPCRYCRVKRCGEKLRRGSRGRGGVCITCRPRKGWAEAWPRPPTSAAGAAATARAAAQCSARTPEQLLHRVGELLQLGAGLHRARHREWPVGESRRVGGGCAPAIAAEPVPVTHPGDAGAGEDRLERQQRRGRDCKQRRRVGGGRARLLKLAPPGGQAQGVAGDVDGAGRQACVVGCVRLGRPATVQQAGGRGAGRSKRQLLGLSRPALADAQRLACSLAVGMEQGGAARQAPAGHAGGRAAARRAPEPSRDEEQALSGPARLRG